MSLGEQTVTFLSRRGSSGVCLLLLSLTLLGAEGQVQWKVKEDLTWNKETLMREYPAVFIGSFDLSPDGRQLGIEFEAMEEGGVKSLWASLWDARTGGLLNRTRVEGAGSEMFAAEEGAYELRFTPNGDEVLLLAKDRLVGFDSASLAKRFSLFAEEGDPLKDFAISEDGNSLVILSQRAVRLLRLADRAPIREWVAPSQAWNVSISADGRWVAIVTYRVVPGQMLPPAAANVYVFDARTGENTFKINAGYLTRQCAFVGSGFLATISANVAEWRRYRSDTLKVWELSSGDLVRELTYKKEGVRGGLSVVPRTGLLAACTHKANKWDLVFDRDAIRSYQRLVLWDLNSGNTVYSSSDLVVQPLPSIGACQIRASEDGRVILAGGSNRIHVFTLAQK